MKRWRSNNAERHIAEQLEKEGYDILSRGWPDFLAVNRRDPTDVRFIEVKPEGKHLKPQQEMVVRALAGIGIKVEVVHSEVTGVTGRPVRPNNRHGQYYRETFRGRRRKEIEFPDTKIED